MILQTGGTALGEISTKSISNSLAQSNAALVGYTPGSIGVPMILLSCSKLSPTKRILGTLI